MKARNRCLKLGWTTIALLLSCIGEVQADVPCTARNACIEEGSFTATVTGFRLSRGRYSRIIDATVRFHNKLSRRLILGYVRDSGVVIDDQGNRYNQADRNGATGIGVIAGNSVDTNFALQPGESADARFEYAWDPGRRVIGTHYELQLVVREINPIPGSDQQFRLGLEHALRIPGLGGEPQVGSGGGAAIATGGVQSVAQESAPGMAQGVAPAAVPAAVPVAPVADLCGGKPHCYSAGPFKAQITQFLYSQGTRYNDPPIIRVSVRFSNESPAPIILAYVSGSAVILDNAGHRFYGSTSGAGDRTVQGMGVVRGNAADTNFVLGPGQSRDAVFQLHRGRDNSVIGTSYTFDASIAQMEILANGQQVRTVRQYSLDFPELTSSTGLGAGVAPGATGVSDAVKQLRGLFGKKK